MMNKIAKILLFLIFVSCSNHSKLEEGNGFITDFSFNPNELPEKGYVKYFESIGIGLGDSSKSEHPQLDYLTKPIIQDSLYIGFGYYEGYNKPLFHTVNVKNLELDSASLSIWLKKMDLVLLSNIQDVTKDKYFFVQSRANGLVYTGSKTLQQYKLISFTAHLPLEKDSPIKRTIKVNCVNYETEKSEMCFNN